MCNILKQVAYEPNMCEVQNAEQPCEYDEQREIEETKLNEHSILLESLRATHAQQVSDVISAYL